MSKLKVDKLEILGQATKFFRDVIAPNHLRNLEELRKLSSFTYNPFLLKYLAVFLSGNTDAVSIAKALIYPRILGTSINTSFGSNLQKFCSTVLPGYGSGVAGIDLEFIDQDDKRKKVLPNKSWSPDNK